MLQGEPNALADGLRPLAVGIREVDRRVVDLLEHLAHGAEVILPPRRHATVTPAPEERQYAHHFDIIVVGVPNPEVAPDVEETVEEAHVLVGFQRFAEGFEFTAARVRARRNRLNML